MNMIENSIQNEQVEDDSDHYEDNIDINIMICTEKFIHTRIHMHIYIFTCISIYIHEYDSE
jgi:hypothetical protein